MCSMTCTDRHTTESNHDAVIFRPGLSTSHEESDNCYQALAAEREVGHGVSSVVSDDTGVFISLLRHSRRGEILI